MKTILSTLVFVALTLFGFAQDVTTVKLSGRITNPSSDTITIEDGWGEQFHITTLRNDGTFEAEFKIKTGYYYLSDLNESTTIYLGENYDLHITLNTDSFDESLSYKGKGANANNYLAKKALIREKWGLLNFYGYYCKLKEDIFLHLTDSIDKVSKQLLNEQTITDENFLKLEKQSIQGDKIYKLKTYPRTYIYFTKDNEYTPSKNYPDPYANFPLNDPTLIPAPMYLSSVNDYMYYNRDTAEYKRTGDYSLYILQSLDRTITNPEVKMNAMNYFCKSRLTSSKKMDECFEIYKSIETDPIRLKIIEDKYIARKKTQKGAISPPFEYENTEGKIITQEDLKGKITYIDLWATWCGPCIREIPYFDTLQEAFKDKEIAFVSICQNDTKERWLKAIETKNLKGLQLYANGDGGQFYKDYQVTGIPRYIILDADGKIIDSDAKRPSDKRLTNELEALLK